MLQLNHYFFSCSMHPNLKNLTETILDSSGVILCSRTLSYLTLSLNTLAFSLSTWASPAHSLRIWFGIFLRMDFLRTRGLYSSYFSWNSFSAKLLKRTTLLSFIWTWNLFSSYRFCLLLALIEGLTDKNHHTQAEMKVCHFHTISNLPAPSVKIY